MRERDWCGEAFPTDRFSNMKHIFQYHGVLQLSPKLSQGPRLWAGTGDPSVLFKSAPHPPQFWGQPAPLMAIAIGRK